jgi:N-acetyl sugar amidotransferase
MDICNRCISDLSIPGVSFDRDGICSYCKLHDKLDNAYPLTDTGAIQLNKIVKSIKKSGEGKKHDCIVGISGGRDSTYTLYQTKELGLRPLAVHFNDGFGNPVAGENMKKVTKKLDIDLITISSDWRESKDLKLAFLKSSTPDLEQGTDVGIWATLYGAAERKKVKWVIIGHSFRTEGFSPLPWNYMDGKYLKEVLQEFGTVKLRRWRPKDPGFNFELQHVFYYTVLKRIQMFPILFYFDYRRKEVDKLLKEQFDWVSPGAHYYDDLYQSLMSYVLRKKFNIDRRRANYSALVRSCQMTRDEALNKMNKVSVIEDESVINLCIKRLGLEQEEFEKIMKLPTKTFRDYKTTYNLIKKMKFLIKTAGKLNIGPPIAYEKLFECG